MAPTLSHILSTKVNIGSQVTRGITRRPNGNFVTIGQAGNNPFNMYEFSYDGTKTSLVKNWGAVNVNDQLQMAGRQLVQMRGLLAEDDTILCSYGTFYSNQVNTPFLCSVVLDASSKYVYGPMSVDSSIHSDTVKGNICQSHCAIRLFTDNKKYLAFGSRGSTAQLQSWGFGLVAIGADMSATRLVHWPMKSVNGVSFSDYPRDVNDGPTVWHKSASDPGTSVTTYGQCDSIHTMAVVGDYIICTGVSAIGRTWYGQKWDMTIFQSLIDPTKQTVGVNNPHGLQAEGYKSKLYVYRISDIVAAIVAGHQRVEHCYVCDLGSIVPSLQSYEMTGIHFDPIENRLYITDPGLGTAAAPVPMLHVIGVY